MLNGSAASANARDEESNQASKVSFKAKKLIELNSIESVRVKLSQTARFNSFEINSSVTSSLNLKTSLKIKP